MQFDELWRELCRELCRDACEDWSPMTPGWPPPLPGCGSSRQLRVEHLDLKNEAFELVKSNFVIGFYNFFYYLQLFT